MTDMLVKLYELHHDWSFADQQRAYGITIRKPLGTEKHVTIAWVKEHFGSIWTSETDMAFSRTPISCFIAVKERQLIGFGCYDATALGYFGPVGVAEAARGKGTGKALLRACLLDMKLKGYGYAIIGFTDVVDFYHNAVGAVEIPDSSPGIWKTWVRTWGG